MTNQTDNISAPPAVSIIVSLYNAENFLQRCVDSLINQTLRDIEILLINDGSTDNSAKICDEYAAEDSRVKVFHRTNHGVAATRKFGLEHVTGDYVIHADSDDWLDLDMLQKMYEVAVKENADMVMCDYIMEYRNYTKRCKQKLITEDSSQIVDEFYNVTGALWNKLVKRECIERYGVTFMEGMDYGDDRIFIMQLVQNPLKTAYCPNVLYHYDKYSGTSTVTGTITPARIYRQMVFINKMLELGLDSPFLCAQETWAACYAIHTKAYSPDDYHQVFSHLGKTNIFKVPETAFHLRLIAWTALHVNYRLAKQMFDIKMWYRRKIKKGEI